jgi:hypothetical protein
MLPLADQVEHRLVVAGVAGDPHALPLHRARALVGLVVLLTVEFERILRAFATGHPTGFLVLLTLAGAGLAVALARRTPRATARAERVLRPLRLAAGQYRKTTPTGQALAFGVALVGGTAMAADDLRFDGLKQQVNAQPLAAVPRRGGKEDGSGCSSSSCSSCGSDGGSGGGSSCGSSCGSGCGGGGD